MYVRKVQKTRKTLSINIPRPVCEAVEIEKGDEVVVKVKNEKIIIAPVRAAKLGTGTAATKPVMVPVEGIHERGAQHG